jgi:hypothetical protein
MTGPNSIGIVAVTTLPLVVATVMAFFGTGARNALTGGMPDVPPVTAAVREKVTAALAGATDADGAVAKDPAGFRGKSDGPAASEPPYATAAVLAAANIAVTSVDSKQVEQALVRLNAMAGAAGDLDGDVAERRGQLERHFAWLANRREAAAAIAAADQALREAVSVAGAEASLKHISELRRRLPKVAAEGEELADAVTADEAKQADTLRDWAEYRRAFLQAKVRQPGGGTVSAEAVAAVIAEWDRFLAKHGKPGMPDPDECVAEARRLRADARLRLLWEKASTQETPAGLAPAIVAWLDEPRGDRDDTAERLAKGTSLIRKWLEAAVPTAPKAPAGIAGLQEGVVDDRQAGKRLIAIFEAVPDVPNRYRWWEAKDQQPSMPLGKASGFLVAAPVEPRTVAWLQRYAKLRDAYVARGGFLTDADSFVRECRTLRDEYLEHMKIPAYEPTNRFDKEASGWAEKVFEHAAKVAEECESALRDSGLRQRLAGGEGAGR